MITLHGDGGMDDWGWWVLDKHRRPAMMMGQWAVVLDIAALFPRMLHVGMLLQ
jgi:hypothetical protein